MESEPHATPGSPSAADKDLLAGHKVGEYVVEAKIGEGGFGAVYRASHPLIGKLAAVKVLHRRYSADPEMVSRFVAEARAVNQIRHRNIIDIFAFGQLDDDRSYYVMELLDGEPLDEYLHEVGAMPLGEAIGVLRAVARALDAAHAKGIAHRDLKPENIFLVRESDGTVFPKLLDFGIAKLMGQASGAAMHKTRTGAPIGTPYYMSPEQCRGRDVDHRTDIYAFGVVAYKLVTGVVPFDGEDYMDILLKQIGEEPVPPSHRVPALPTSVDDAIAWMMKKDPAARPPNLITAMRALEDAAVAAGIPLESDRAGSAVYATPSATVSAQRTPSGLARVPATTPGRASDALGNAATMEAGRLTDVTDAMGATRAATTGPGVVPAATLSEPASRRSPLVLAGALAAAVAVGAIVFFLVRPGAEDPAEPAAAPPPVAERGPEPDPAGSGSGAAPVPPTPPPAPRLVRITIEGPPAGTEVYGPGGRPLGVAPGDIQVERADGELILTFQAPDHVVATRTIRPAEDQIVQVILEPKPPDIATTKPPRKPGGRDRGGKGDRAGKGGKGDGTGTGSGRNALEDPFAPR